MSFTTTLYSLSVHSESCFKLQMALDGRCVEMSGLESVLVSVTFTYMSIRLERISRGKFREKEKK